MESGNKLFEETHKSNFFISSHTVELCDRFNDFGYIVFFKVLAHDLQFMFLFLALCHVNHFSFGNGASKPLDDEL